MQNYKYFDLAQFFLIFCTKYAILRGKTERLSLIDQNICKKNDQNSVILSEAVHGEMVKVKVIKYFLQVFAV